MLPLSLTAALGGLIKKASHVGVPFWGTMVVRYSCTLFISRTCADPGSEMLMGRKCGAAMAPTSAMI